MWAYAVVDGNLPGGVWNESCPRSEGWRLPPACSTLEWNVTYYDTAYPQAWVGPQPPLPAQQMTAADCSAISREEYWDSDNVHWESEDAEDPNCSYGSWRYSGRDYNVLRGWGSYQECQDADDDATEGAQIHVVDGCSESYTWTEGDRRDFKIENLPRESAQVDLRHDHAYGQPEYSYPVRRARPVLVPNP